MQDFLPTSKFSAITLSIFFAAGLIFAANALTHPSANTLNRSPSDDAALAAAQANWQATLYAIQEQAGVSLPTAPDPHTVDGLRQAAASTNMTDTVARSLLVNLTNAKAQGLGDDIPTQNQLIAQAAQQLKQTSLPAYTQKDIVTVDDTKASQHAYANALAQVLAANASGSEYADTLLLIDNATAQHDATQLKKLSPIKSQYQTITTQLLNIPVPETLAPFHLLLVNNFKHISDAYDPMSQLLADPLAGLAALQTYQSLTKETTRVFINIAQAINKDGILFTKDEPGASWASVLSLQ